jgi:hypothetical protein
VCARPISNKHTPLVSEPPISGLNARFSVRHSRCVKILYFQTTKAVSLFAAVHSAYENVCAGMDLQQYRGPWLRPAHVRCYSEPINGIAAPKDLVKTLHTIFIYFQKK